MSDDELPAGAELLWGPAKRPARGPRPALSVQRIVAEAIAVADGEGLSALTMPRLARRLGAGTMSLYRYVPGKAELLGLVVDAATGPPPVLDAARDGWRAAVTAWAHGNRAIFLAHPWLIEVVLTERVMGPNEIGWLEAGLAAFDGTPLGPARRFDAVYLVNGYVRGSAMELAGPAGEPVFSPSMLARFGREDEFPHVIGALGALAREAPVEDEAGERFAFGLDRLIDGIESHMRAAGPA